MRNALLTRRAKEMRKDMPEQEMRLWLELRAGRFHGIKFRRQKVIGEYIADFASNEPKLVIELDGDTHTEREIYDTVRTRFLEEEGYRVVSFDNADVIQNFDGVLEQLSVIVAELGYAPPPTPSPKGEGAVL